MHQCYRHHVQLLFVHAWNGCNKGHVCSSKSSVCQGKFRQALVRKASVSSGANWRPSLGGWLHHGIFLRLTSMRQSNFHQVQLLMFLRACELIEIESTHDMFVLLFARIARIKSLAKRVSQFLLVFVAEGTTTLTCRLRQMAKVDRCNAYFWSDYSKQCNCQ